MSSPIGNDANMSRVKAVGACVVRKTNDSVLVDRDTDNLSKEGGDLMARAGAREEKEDGSTRGQVLLCFIRRDGVGIAANNNDAGVGIVSVAGSVVSNDNLARLCESMTKPSQGRRFAAEDDRGRFSSGGGGGGSSIHSNHKVAVRMKSPPFFSNACFLRQCFQKSPNYLKLENDTETLYDRVRLCRNHATFLSMSSFINQNSRKWLDEANASNSTSTPEDGDGSSICIDHLYSPNGEKRMEEIKHTASLLRSDMGDTDADEASKHPKTLQLLADNNQLLSALARMLREGCVSSDLCQIFFHLSLFPDYHPLLLSHGIGSALMDHLIRTCNVKRARIDSARNEDEADGSGEETRDDQSLSFGADETDGTDTDADAITRGSSSSSKCTTTTTTASGSAPSSSSNRRSALSSNQEQIISLCLAILDNLADDVDVRRKMFKSGQLLTPLFACLVCKTTDCVVRSLLLLRKASMFEEVVEELSQNDGKYLKSIIHVAIESTDADADDDTEEKAIIADHVVRLLFNASFHKECRKMMADAQALIVLLTAVARNENSPSRQVCTNLLKVLCLEMLDSCCQLSFED